MNIKNIKGTNLQTRGTEKPRFFCLDRSKKLKHETLSGKKT